MSTGKTEIWVFEFEKVGGTQAIAAGGGEFDIAFEGTVLGYRGFRSRRRVVP
jgi:hypothetical protein